MGAVPVNFAKAVTMSPVRIELATDPGGHVNGIIKVSNDERITRTLYLSVEKFKNKDETGEPNFVKDATDELVQWTKIQPSVTIPPLDFREIPFTVDVPAGVDPGGYFAAIFASVIPPAPDGGELSLQNDVGTLLLFRVNGQFPEGETILEFNTKDKKNFFNHLPVEFYFRFQNSGKDRAQPIGDVTIRNMFGGVSKIISANRGAGNVLPESIRRFDAAWVTAGGDEIEDFEGEVKQPEIKNFIGAVKYQWDNFALGRYTGELKLTVNNDSSRSYQKQMSFWIVPWQLIVVILAILILFVLPLILLMTMILVYLRRRRKR